MKILAACLIVLFFVLQYDLWLGEGSLMAAWKLENAISHQKEENQHLNARNDTLSAEVKDLKSGLAAIEERSRSELGMIKKDETFVQVIDEDKQ